MRQSNALRVATAGCALVLAAGCRSPRPSGGQSSHSATSAPPVPGPSADAPEAASDRPAPGPRLAVAPVERGSRVPARPASLGFEEPPASRVFVDCHAGFAPGESPRVDVQRLSLSCGPSTGLTPYAHTSGAVDESGAPVVLRWEAKRGDCFRLFAVASAPVADLEVEIARAPDLQGSLTNQNRRWLVVGEEAPFCSSRAGTFLARFSTHAGSGVFAAVVSRGERMLAMH